MTNGERTDSRGSIVEISSRIDSEEFDTTGRGSDELKNTFVDPRERFDGLRLAIEEDDDEGEGWSEDNRGSVVEFEDESSSAAASFWP